MTTAGQVVNRLLDSGLFRDQIRGEHLDDVYQQLCSTRQLNFPDHKFVKQLVLPRPDCTGSSKPLWGVIVETRVHPALEYVINNVVSRLGIPVQLFFGPSAEKFILSTSIYDLVRNGQVYMTPVGVDQLGARKYNALLLSEKFWESVCGNRKILLFQTDSILCNNSKYTIGDFIDYDYIGSKWKRERPNGMIMDGGNGGFSVRDKQKALECIKRFPPDAWMGGEDGYFAFHLDVMGAKVGRDNECAKFSTQNEFLYPSFGAHNVAKKLNPDQMGEFLRYCPEARGVLV